MGKKSSSNSLTSTLAYLAMVFSAILWSIYGINNLIAKINDGKGFITNGNICNALQTIALCCVYLVVAIVAYGFTKGKSTGVKVFYWVFVILFVAVVILGII